MVANALQAVARVLVVCHDGVQNGCQDVFKLLHGCCGTFVVDQLFTRALLSKC